MRKLRVGLVLASMAAWIGACGTDLAVLDPAAQSDAGTPDAAGSSDASADGSTPAPATFAIGGSVSGLLGTGLVLQNNDGDEIAIAKNGTFAFPTKLKSKDAFKVTIKKQPSTPSQTCAVSAGTGTVLTGDVTTVAVNCSDNTFTVSGTVAGLSGNGLVLQNNAGDEVAVTAGTFAFPTALKDGASYAVTVKSHPSDPTQTCTVTKGTGTIAAANVSDVVVTCTTNKYVIGGTVTGLKGSGLVLKNNGGDELPVNAAGTFAFATPIESGQTFEVTVGAQPGTPTQTCTVSGGSGAVVASDITSVTVNCATDAYTLGGTVTGLEGGGLVLQNNAGNDRAIGGNGEFAFSAPVANGGTYAVTVKTHPSSPSQTCAVTNGAGTMGLANVTDVAIGCVTNQYKIGGKVSGLAGAGLVLQVNGGADVPVAADGSFEFGNTIASGKTYTVTVKSQPTNPSQECSVANGTGTVGAANIGDVEVSCVTSSFTVGGNVNGLIGKGLVLQNNSGDDLAVSGDGPFTFGTKITSGGVYGVSIKSQPTDPTQTCTLSAESGNVTNGNIATVAINCTTNKYSVSAAVSGLVGTGLVLQNNGGDDLTVNGDGTVAFGAPVASGVGYAVTVKTQPSVPSQTCVVTDGSGTVVSSPVDSVKIVCTTNTYKVGGSVTGLAGSGLVLRNNGGDDLPIAQNGGFTFGASVTSGGAYAVTVQTQPAGEHCTVSSGSGSVVSANVTSVVVTCAALKKVFVTSVLYSGNLGGLDGADAKCQSLAGLASRSGTYRAWLSDSTGSPSTRFTRSTGPYVLVDGTVVADSYAALTNANIPLKHIIDQTETGGAVPTGNTSCLGGGQKTVWSSTRRDGTYLGTGTCSNWTSTSGGSGWGWSTNTGYWSEWCSGGLCSWVSPLYCFEQ